MIRYPEIRYLEIENPETLEHEIEQAEQQVVAEYLAFSNHLQAYTIAQMRDMGATLRMKKATEVTLPPPLKHPCRIRYLGPRT